ncbi:MAG: copper resistance protein B, partial [Novosphingobium sp.]
SDRAALGRGGAGNLDMGKRGRGQRQRGGGEQGWKLGGSARYARLAGEDPSVTSLVMGVRFWF